MILSKAFEMYKKDRETLNYSPKTLKQYSIQMNLLIRHLGDIPIDSVTYANLKDYIQMSSKVLDKTSSLAQRIKFTRVLFTWAVEEELILQNPALKLRTPKQGKPIPKFIPDHEIELMRNACRNDLDRALLETAYSTGARVSEIHSLNIDDVDFANRTILLNGKGDKERYVFFDSTCKFWLGRYLNSRKDDCEALFVSERGEVRRRSVYQLRYVIKRIAKRTEIKESVFPHRMRHSLATRLVSKGADIGFVARILGHSSTKTTEIYVSVSRTRLKQEYDRYG